MIAVEHAEKSYKGVKVLDDVSLFVPTGCIAGFQGINGSGKTMLMRAMRPDSPGLRIRKG